MTEPIILPTERRTPLEPPAELREIAARRPLTRLSFPDGHVGWLVTSYATARAVLADDRFSNRAELQHLPGRLGASMRYTKPVEPGRFLWHDPPQHTRYRKLLIGQFTVRRLKELASRIEEIVHECLDAMAAIGPPADLMSTYALPIPSRVICELLGVPYQDRAAFQDHIRTTHSFQATKEAAAAAAQGIVDYLRDLVNGKRAESTDDVLGGLVQNSDLTDQELTNVAYLLLTGGHETTANMLGLGTLALLTNWEQLDALLADPGAIDNAVEELLRHQTIIQFGTGRAALEDVELDGQLVKAGETVMISLPQANRDPDRFDDPETLDLRRPATGHLSFGHGIHQCLGQQLARMELRAGYLELFRRFPTLRLAVPADQVVARDAPILGPRELPVTW